MRDNLLEALRNERLLLVLDNFETNLESVQGKDGYACADPEWDRLLDHLADELPGTGSRLLVTSRHRLASLSSALWLPLGPLPMGEAALFLQGTEELRRLAFGDEAAERAEEARVARHDHVGDPELPGEEEGLGRAGSAVGDQREVARIDAASGHQG